MGAAANTWGSHPLGLSTQRGPHQGPVGLTLLSPLSRREQSSYRSGHTFCCLSLRLTVTISGTKCPTFRFHSTAQWVQAEKRLRALGRGGVNSKPASAL